MKIEDFREYLLREKNYSPNTTHAYTRDLEFFYGFALDRFSISSLEEVDYKMIRSWIVEMVESGISNRSVNRKISSLQSYYLFLLKIGVLEVSPLEKHRSLKEAKKIQLPFSQKEMEGALAKKVEDDFEEVRDKFMVELFYSTGMRRAELINLKIEQLHPQSEYVKIHGKGNKDRVVPLLSSVRDSLIKYWEKRSELEEIRDKEFLFLTKKGRKLYDTLVYRTIEDYFTGVSTKLKISPHILRHTFATHLLNEGADINSIKHLMGHESLSSTQVYVHNDIAALRKVHAKAHPRNKKSKK